MIYFIRNNTTGNIKIGWTEGCPWSRMAQMQTGSDGILEMLGWMQGSKIDERLLHFRFDSNHIQGEWFSPNSELHQLIKTECSMPPYVSDGRRTNGSKKLYKSISVRLPRFAVDAIESLRKELSTKTCGLVRWSDAARYVIELGLDESEAKAS